METPMVNDRVKVDVGHCRQGGITHGIGPNINGQTGVIIRNCWMDDGVGEHSWLVKMDDKDFLAQFFRADELVLVMEES